MIWCVVLSEDRQSLMKFLVTEHIGLLLFIVFFFTLGKFHVHLELSTLFP